MRTATRRVLAGLVVGAALLAGCSDDDEGDDALRTELEASLVASGLTTEDGAECLVDGLFDRYDAAELDALASTGQASEDLIDDLAEISSECIDEVGVPTTEVDVVTDES